MITYLEKYNNLPSNLRDAISAPDAMAAISEIENYYNVSLAIVIMRVMVKDISIVDLPKYFVFEYNLEARAAENLAAELKDRVFINVADYLGITMEAPVEPAAVEINDEIVDKDDDWIHDRQKEAGVRSSNFFFSSDDEEEVKELSKKVAGFKKDIAKSKEQNEQALQEQVNKIVYKMNLNFSSDELHSRYWQAIYTYVKGVRNKIDTKQTLMKDPGVGGMGLNSSLADQTVAVADKIKQEDQNSLDSAKVSVEAKSGDLPSPEPADIIEGPRPAGPEQNKKKETESAAREEKAPPAKPSVKQVVSLGKSGVRDFDYDFSALKKQTDGAILKANNKEGDKPAAENEIKHQITEQKKDRQIHTINLRADGEKKDADLPLGRDGNKSQTDSRGEESKEKILEDIEGAAKKKGLFGGFKRTDKNINTPSQSIAGAMSKRKKLKNGKVMVQDVKYVPKLTGPIDELKEMDPLNFRRLNKDAEIAAAKIKGKIEFLEEDSYAKRLEAIHAWRQSPVNQLYLNIGRESINKHKGISEIIDDLKAAKKDFLSYGEFKAVMKLNNSLRF